MKIFDCFMFYDEEMILDFRLNYLNEYVDKFIVVESSYTHSGKRRELLFDEKKYTKFRDKISYLVLALPGLNSIFRLFVTDLIIYISFLFIK